MTHHSYMYMHNVMYNFRFSLTFSMVDRTVCPIRYNEKFENPRYPLFYIDVFTSSDDPQPYSFMIEPVENFILAYVTSSVR